MFNQDILYKSNDYKLNKPVKADTWGVYILDHTLQASVPEYTD